MGWEIIFSPEALEDLAEAVRYIAKDNPEAAERIGNALIDRVLVLQKFPFLGPPYLKRPGVRTLVSKPYPSFTAFWRKRNLFKSFVIGMRLAPVSTLSEVKHLA